MTNIDSDRISMYDVDGTLIRWIFDLSADEYQEVCNYQNNNDGALPEGYFVVQTGDMGEVLLKENKDVTNLLKHQALAGATVIVWSASGSKWADKITKALGLEKYVAITMAKPTWYNDDLHCSIFMGQWNKVGPDGKFVAKPEVVAEIKR